MAVDKLAGNADLTDPDDIDRLLGDIQNDEEASSTPLPTKSDSDEPLSDVETSEEENKGLIDNFTNDYVSPFLSVDFSELLNENAKDLSNDANEETTGEDNSLSDDLDIDALLAEDGGDSSDNNNLDIGDDILINEQPFWNMNSYYNEEQQIEYCMGWACRGTPLT